MSIIVPTATRTLARRTTWMLLDQAANSLFSLSVGLLAAQLLGVDEFGIFATLFAAYLVVRDSLRALLFDPLIIRHASLDSPDQAPMVNGLAVLGALVATGTVLLTTVFWSSLDLGTALAFGLATLVLVVVDGLRAHQVLDARPDRAALLSGLLVVGSAFGALGLVAGTPNTSSMFAVLLIGGGLAAASQWRRLSVETRPAVLRDWMRSHRSIGVPLFIDYLASSGIVSLALFVLASLDIEQAAGLRGAQMVAAPIALLQVALVQAITAEGARLRKSAPEAIERFGWHALGAMIGGGLLLLGVVAVAQSTVLGILGDSGPATRPVLFPMIAFTIAAAPALAATGVLRSRDESRRALHARLATSVAFAPALLAGAFLDGARGVAIGGTLAQLLTGVVWWRAVAATRPRENTVDPRAANTSAPTPSTPRASAG